MPAKTATASEQFALRRSRLVSHRVSIVVITILINRFSSALVVACTNAQGTIFVYMRGMIVTTKLKLSCLFG